MKKISLTKIAGNFNFLLNDRLLGKLFSVFVLCSALFISNVLANTTQTGMRGLNGLEVTADMGPGINLFNTLDANNSPKQGLESETCWGNPYTSLEMITAWKQKGFKTIRIPVTWYNHMGSAPDYKIDSTWMSRVEEVANYAFVNDMYVIINIHHDDYDIEKPGTWLCPSYEKQEACTYQLEKVWIQIANRFKNYSDYLIFETMNEPRVVGSPEEWTGGNAEHRAVVNAFNLAAVNAIRNTGGNNETRFIMIPQVTGNPEAAIDALVIPNNDKNILVSLHNYNPFEFCLKKPGVKIWGTLEEKAKLKDEINSYYNNFVSKGRGVVLGEWGATGKDNLPERLEYYDTFVSACKSNRIATVAWICDFNRNTLTWPNAIVDAIINPFMDEK